MSQPACSSAFPLNFPSFAAEEVHLGIGGVLTSVDVASDALSILTESPGLMVRQPLASKMNPLSACDYHAEAAPYREQYYSSLTFKGRGAAGRPATKHAFMHALRVRIELAMRDAPLIAAGAPLLAEAYEAMRSDVSYIASLSQMAVSVLEGQHQWRLRSELHQVQQAAIRKCEARNRSCAVLNACGTGFCPFAKDVYKLITAPAGPGKTPRPSNHDSGEAFSSDQALEQLYQLRPFKIREALK